jgi:hypothetical protein
MALSRQVPVRLPRRSGPRPRCSVPACEEWPVSSGSAAGLHLEVHPTAVRRSASPDLQRFGWHQRTLFTLDRIDDPEPRRAAGQELNKGESRNSLARAVFIHRLGEIRDRTDENQQHRASGLNFLVTVIILWNTRNLERAIAVLRQTEDMPDHLLAHLSPLGREHVNLTGDYVWGAAEQMTENPDEFLPLRMFSEPATLAA